MFAPNEVTVTQPKLLELWFSSVFVILSIHALYLVNSNLVYFISFLLRILKKVVSLHLERESLMQRGLQFRA